LCQVKEDIGWWITIWLMVSVREFNLKSENLTFLNTQESVQIIYKYMHLWSTKLLGLANFYHVSKCKFTHISFYCEDSWNESFKFFQDLHFFNVTGCLFLIPAMFILINAQKHSLSLLPL
jgi:hypothetical protein